jgi:hypothetical protein
MARAAPTPKYAPGFLHQYPERMYIPGLRPACSRILKDRLLGRRVRVDWIGVALAIVGIGIALLPLADQFSFPDQFSFLKPYAVPGGVALILVGLLLCLVPIWKRIHARREAKRAPVPLIYVLRYLRSAEIFKYLDDGEEFSDAIITLASAGRIKVYGVPGEVYPRALTEIPARHFDDQSLWVQDTENGRYISETIREAKKDVHYWDDAGRYFSLAASPNIWDELAKYTANPPPFPEAVARRRKRWKAIDERLEALEERRRRN